MGLMLDRVLVLSQVSSEVLVLVIFATANAGPMALAIWCAIWLFVFPLPDVATSMVAYSFCKLLGLWLYRSPSGCIDAINIPGVRWSELGLGKFL